MTNQIKKQVKEVKKKNYIVIPKGWYVKENSSRWLALEKPLSK